MAEYIDLDTPLEVYVARGGYCEKKITSLRELLDVNHLRYEIADVRIVEHGKWIDDAGGDSCSVCGMTFNDLHPLYDRARYCPNCGATMEGRHGIHRTRGGLSACKENM